MKIVNILFFHEFIVGVHGQEVEEGKLGQSGKATKEDPQKNIQFLDILIEMFLSAENPLF